MPSLPEAVEPLNKYLVHLPCVIMTGVTLIIQSVKNDA